MCFEINLFKLICCHMVLTCNWDGAWNLGGLSWRLQKLGQNQVIGNRMLCLGLRWIQFFNNRILIDHILVQCCACLPHIEHLIVLRGIWSEMKLPTSSVICGIQVKTPWLGCCAVTYKINLHETTKKSSCWESSSSQENHKIKRAWTTPP